MRKSFCLFFALFLTIKESFSRIVSVGVDGTAKDEDQNDYIHAACNRLPILKKSSLLPASPVEMSGVNKTYPNIFPNVTGYRFINPHLIHYDGVCASPDLTSNVLFSPGPAVAEATWFKGFSWKVIYSKGCEGHDSHLGGLINI